MTITKATIISFKRNDIFTKSIIFQYIPYLSLNYNVEYSTHGDNIIKVYILAHKFAILRGITNLNIEQYTKKSLYNYILRNGVDCEIEIAMKVKTSEMIY